ncbi:hypothetical protein PIB30_018137 [Stylosanthes scabra]|uniref:Uncharacterized protein n=1 Tax=Stylosanthes scabra TaxID=79078 RepID=A0ABU6Q7Q7_9FABA|nr:hypothetical protein [Stylosanthes scabra]
MAELVAVARGPRETTTGDLKNFLKMKSEREHSASNVSLEEVKSFTDKQKKLHGYIGEEDLTSVWSEHFQSKSDFDLIGSVDDVTMPQFMQVYATRLLCIGRYDELKTREETEQKKGNDVEVDKNLELERKLQVAMEQVASKEKELAEMKSDNEQLKGKLQKLDRDKIDLEARVVELCSQKKEAEPLRRIMGMRLWLLGLSEQRSKPNTSFLI